jgi:hypothetical protein
MALNIATASARSAAEVGSTTGVDWRAPIAGAAEVVEDGSDDRSTVERTMSPSYIKSPSDSIIVCA